MQFLTGTDRDNCWHRRCRLHRLNRCNRSEGLSLEAPATERRGGRIGAASVAACVVVFACTSSTAAIVPRVCPSMLRRPNGGRQNWCDLRSCLRRCFGLRQLNRCNRSKGLSLEAPVTERRGGRIGATCVTACVVVFACTNSIAAIVPRVCPSRLRRPYCGAAELVRPA
jgi:hypothetical protein